MGKIIFFLSVIILLGAGSYSLKTGKSIVEIDLPVIQNFGLQNQPDSLESILIGKWEFNTFMKAPKTIHRYTGKVEYKDDGTFYRYITLKYYRSSGKVAEEERYLDNSGGGRIDGEWSTNINSDGTIKSWTEKLIRCGVEEAYNFQICPRFQNAEYGNTSTDQGEFKLEVLTDSIIVIKGYTFDNEGTRTYEFRRIE